MRLFQPLLAIVNLCCMIHSTEVFFVPSQASHIIMRARTSPVILEMTFEFMSTRCKLLVTREGSKADTLIMIQDLAGQQLS